MTKLNQPRESCAQVKLFINTANNKNLKFTRPNKQTHIAMT